MNSVISNTRARGTDNARVRKLIETKAICGAGTEEDPVRYIYQYWDFHGKLIAEHDTIDDMAAEETTEEVLSHFIGVTLERDW